MPALQSILSLFCNMFDKLYRSTNVRVYISNMTLKNLKSCVWCENLRILLYIGRSLVKSAYQKNIFLISQPKHML